MTAPRFTDFWHTTAEYDKARRELYAWKVAVGTNTLQGTTFSAAWIDEPKRKPKSTHEIW